LARRNAKIGAWILRPIYVRGPGSQPPEFTVEVKAAYRTLTGHVVLVFDTYRFEGDLSGGKVSCGAGERDFASSRSTENAQAMDTYGQYSDHDRLGSVHHARASMRLNIYAHARPGADLQSAETLPGGLSNARGNDRKLSEQA
jgi:hypothetical protein